jgi:PPM family protein phosphatase
MQVCFSTVSDAGTERGDNEDATGSYAEAPAHLLVVVADGVSGVEGGEVASRTAVDVVLSTYRDSPAAWGPSKRLYRSAQQANIAIYDKALIVPELRGMATTLTAVVAEGEVLHAAHVGDSRLYLLREGTITQKTKDHTVAAGRWRTSLIPSASARSQAERSTLTRSLGRELICAIDRITFPLRGGDVLLVCTDGLYNVLADEEIRALAVDPDPDDACRGLLRAVLERGAPDNVSAAVMRVTGEAPAARASRWPGALERLLGR